MAEQKGLYERFNNDNILIRSVIVGLLDLLNNHIDYSQIWDDNIEQTVTVPWWYNFGTSDEKYMQDNYTFFGKKCFNEKMINGTFSSIPRGYISYNGSNIEASSITNRFIMGKYMKQVGGKLISYTSFLYSIPLTVNFDCTVDCDNILSALKIEQAIRETFYKNKTFFVLYKGLRIGCTAGIPESFNSEKTTEYSFDNASKNPKLTFNITVETYQPVFDKTTETEASKVIKYFSKDIFVSSTERKKSIEITNKSDLSYNEDTNPVIFPSGSPMLIEWIQRSPNSEMLDVFVSAIDECGCETVLSEPYDYSREHFIWNIPEKYSNFSEIKMTIGKNVDVVKEPIIKIIPDLKTKEIKESSFVIIENGILYNKDVKNSETVPIKLSYTDDIGKPHVITNYFLRIDNGKIDINDPILVKGETYAKYEGKLSPKRISLRVFYLNEKNDNDIVEDKVDNVLIL